jgi:two-component system, NarL family, nitrate/nitrite response regulator NarL
MDNKIRILIADDHPILRDGLRKLLQAEADFLVVGEAADGDEALAAARQLEPDLMLLDRAMPGVPYFDVLRQLAASSLPTRPLLLTASIDSQDIVKALQLGAWGVVMKDAASEILRKAIRTVMKGQYWITRESVGSLVDAFRARGAAPRDRRFGLTPRELDIVLTVASGLTNREIAQRFALSEETVKHHLTRVFTKLGVSNRLELALFAISEQLVDSAAPSRVKASGE